MAHRGDEWRCRSCGTFNPSDYVRCGQCRARKDAPPPRPMPDSHEAMQPLPGERGGCGRRLAGALLIAILASGALLYYTFRQSVESVEVAGLAWRRSIDIEAWSTVRDEAWEEELPPGARAIGRRREVHHTEPEQVATERVRVGTREAGNGALEDVFDDRPVYRERPVYATKVSYEIERWTVARTARAEGQDQTPRWPDPALAAGEREGRRSQGYTVILKGRREYRKELTEDRWASLRLGQRLTATIRAGTVERLE
jgi:hypothetical protein